jgi:aspartate/methionine/tyrosine aminotransferase
MYQFLQERYVLQEQYAPTSSSNIHFYCAEHSSIGQNYARFAFCKDIDTLIRACQRLEEVKKYLQ